ncbi:putative transcription factor BES/BZR family [Lupinus albus]|uniref:Protein BZR1 homolog n=1 Tax=Lupinus albus TaxID=3870 RepID=A0A6A4NMM8_LUPAL|nr:putative transcription factor BES/BZR family [Lupinus albus]
MNIYSTKHPRFLFLYLLLHFLEYLIDPDLNSSFFTQISFKVLFFIQFQRHPFAFTASKFKPTLSTMTSGSRLPTWKERENNKRRERRRRAIAAKIFSGLRMYGNFKLPKHCDNNEVLKALCSEAGWTVEPDGTTYRKGCKATEGMDIVGGLSSSAAASPCSSYHPSPCASYNPSPGSSSFPSPSSTPYVINPNNDGNSLIPWLKNLSTVSSSPKLPHLYLGSISAPVTPPLSSPTARTPRINADWDDQTARPGWTGQHYSFMPSSTPQSPARQAVDPEWFAGIKLPHVSPTSPTFALVSSNPFAFNDGGSSRMWTPGQSGTCSPAMAVGSDHIADIPMSEAYSDEFAFGSNTSGIVKPWEGERIHEEFVADDLELTLGISKTR